MTALTPVEASHTRLEEAHLEIVDPPSDGGPIPLRFNPAEYQIKKGQTFAEIAIPGLPTPPLQWVRGGLATLAFSALVDTTHNLKDVDDEYVSRLRGLLDPDPKLHAPPLVAFVWGRRRFVGVLDGLDITYQLFNQQGIPLRAKLGISIKEYRTVAAQLREHRKSSSDVEKTYLVRRGDTLRSIASAVYADPSRWRELAVANSIRDPRSLRPGQQLLVPRLR
jgi:nucleoid-associated protein YgaU